jgi:outer membrane murein-binding lipoprotein Lpp
MATAEELSQQIAETKDALQAAIGRVEEDIENLRNQTGGIDPADLDPISSGLADLKANLDALDPDPDNPPTEPTP